MKTVVLMSAIWMTAFFSVVGYAQQQPATPEDSLAPPPATVTGSGTANYIPRWTGTSTLGNSKVYQTGGKIGINTTTPTVQLDVNGRINAATSYRLHGLDVLIVTNGQSVGLGPAAMESLSTGVEETAIGAGALVSATTADDNTAVGFFALSSVTSGNYNTAVGSDAMSNTTTGTQNTAAGLSALWRNTIGSSNTALGQETLANNTTGNSNIAIGLQAANNVSGGNSNNIHIGSAGVSTDNGTTRIGTSGLQASFFAAGISGVVTGLNDAVPVVVDSNGQLGTVSSSRRFKEDIQDMGEVSRGLMQLRPVTFRYQKPFADGSKPIQYGLVAEEVQQVYPDLVTHSADGQVETVKYQVLDSMLLNEVQRQQAEIRSLQERLGKMEAMLESMARAPDDPSRSAGKR